MEHNKCFYSSNRIKYDIIAARKDTLANNIVKKHIMPLDDDLDVNARISRLTNPRSIKAYTNVILKSVIDQIVYRASDRYFEAIIYSHRREKGSLNIRYRSNYWENGLICYYNRGNHKGFDPLNPSKKMIETLSDSVDLCRLYLPCLSFCLFSFMPKI